MSRTRMKDEARDAFLERIRKPGCPSIGTNAKKYTSIIATHEYGGSAAAYPEIAEAGKEFWETEVYDLGSTVEDTGMTSALRVANVMHTALTVSNVNAWHFWWVYPCSDQAAAMGPSGVKGAIPMLQNAYGSWVITAVSSVRVLCGSMRLPIPQAT